MISLYKPEGAEHVEYYAKAVSEAFAFNDLVGINTSGYLTKFLDGSSFPCVGLIQKTIAANDTDYAVATRVPVLIPNVNSIFLCDVSTGSAAITDIGEYIDVDDSNSVDVGTSTNNDFYVVGVISPTQVLAKLINQPGKITE